MKTKNIAIVCQGGGSHAAYAAGALQSLLQELEKQELESQPELRLTGLSGTSGGAICALLAWYGRLKGGSSHARQLLENFWQSNCATLPGEQVWNDSAIRVMDALPYEILFSPYQWPTNASLSMLTRVWPMWSAWMAPFSWAPFKGMRGDFFQLDELIKPHVDFQLIAALGAYCSIPSDIARWHTARLQATMYGDQGPGLTRMAQLETKIRASLHMQDTIWQLMDANAFPDNAPLRTALRNGPKSIAQADGGTLDGLGNAIAKVMESIPHLLLGAVDVGNGEFVAFSSERAHDDNGISLKAVLASAALPWLFKPVQIDRKGLDDTLQEQQFWDGLFSQNPPIKNFISGKDNQRKPDELWVVQINPIECDLKTLQNDIWDRRNELSGNLSLNQEVDFISAINKRVDAASAAGLRPPPGAGDDDANADKHLHVHRIVMNNALIEKKMGKPLGSLSKADRSLHLKELLMEDGKQQAGDFVLMRAAMLEACDDLDSRLYQLASPDSVDTLGALRALTALPSTTTAATAADTGPAAATAAAANDRVRLIIDETTMPPVSRKGGDKDAEPYQSLVRWHTRGVLNGETQVNVEGETEFRLRGDNGNRVVVARAIRISSVEGVAPRKPDQPMLPTGIDRRAPAAGGVGKPAPKVERRPGS